MKHLQSFFPLEIFKTSNSPYQEYMREKFKKKDVSLTTFTLKFIFI